MQIAEQDLVLRESLWARGYWEVPEGLDTSNFDFSWRPFKYDKPYVHQFGTQWQKTGGPKFVIPDNLGVKYQTNQIAIMLPEKANRSWRPLIANATIDYSWHPDENDPPFIYVFGNQWYDVDTMPTYQYRVKGATDKKYITSVTATLLPNKENRAWRPLKSNIEFDSSWIPHPHDPPYIYVFGNQWHSAEEMPTVEYRVKGATDKKYIDVPLATLIVDNVSAEDSIFDKVMSASLRTNFTHFGNTKLNYVELITDYSIKQIHIIDNVAAIVPDDAKAYMHDKLTDYPYVKYHTLGLVNEPLDIIFLSNGESCADENYQHLLNLTKDLPNRVVELRGVKGRVASQHAAANLSKTPWYFLVNAKLRVDENFDFSWQPNRMITAKHYIFTASNPVNGLEYGHQAIVANNKRLTLSTAGTKLDFTLESPHEVINVNSGIGMFNTSAWDSWRTAFREVIKLKHATDNESKARLNTWLTIAAGDHSEWCLQGAKDAENYYNLVNGEFSKLKLSYDWEWLAEYYSSVYLQNKMHVYVQET